jgi:glucose-1-phosphate thymidylyltransferase
MGRGDLNVAVLLRGTAWFDTDTSQGPLDAGQFVAVVEARQGDKIDC